MRSAGELSRIGLHQGWTALLALFSIGCLLLAGGWGGLSTAKAATLGEPQDQPLVVLQVRQGPLVPLSASNRPAVVGIACSPQLNSYDRTHLCWETRLTFRFWEDKQPVGTLTVNLVQTMTLNPRATGWEEQDAVTQVVPTGVTAPVRVRLAATCGQSCQATASFQGVIRVGLKGTVAYRVQLTKKGQVYSTLTRYALSYEAPPYVPLNDGIWDSPLAYRCDDALAVKSRATLPPGCVFPAFTPTLELSLSQYGAAAALIAWAQQHMIAHWGLAGRGQPLTRLQDEQRVGRNRYIICQRDWQALPPWTAQGGRLKIKDSCDEFPFAGTYQSGASLVQGGTACVQLQAVKTNEWGQSPAHIWTTVQPIGPVRATAPCVRGHIPLILNTVEGGAYGLFANAQRLLDRDPFWIAVVP